MSLGNVTKFFVAPIGQKGRYGDNGRSGCLRYLIMIVILILLTFTILFILDRI